MPTTTKTISETKERRQENGRREMQHHPDSICDCGDVYQDHHLDKQGRAWCRIADSQEFIPASVFDIVSAYVN